MDILYKNIKLRRESLGLSQDALAEKVGYTSRSSIAKIENGDVDIPRSKIIAFADALKCSPMELMGWEDLDESKEKEEPTTAPLGAMENELLAKFSALPETAKQHVLQYLDLLTNGTLVAGGTQLSAAQREILDSRIEEIEADQSIDSCTGSDSSGRSAR